MVKKGKQKIIIPPASLCLKEDDSPDYLCTYPDTSDLPCMLSHESFSCDECNYSLECEDDAYEGR